jgi:hypothetical protein
MHGWEAEVMGTSHRTDLSGFAVRLQTYALKLAALYRISACAYDDDPPDHEVDEQSVRQAIAYCRVLWQNVAGLIDEDVAVTKESKELRRLKGIIGHGTTRSDALKLSKLRAKDFDQYVDTLVQSGEVTNEKRKASDVGIDRLRDTTVQWLAARNGHVAEPLEFPAVHLAAVPSSSLEFQGEPQEPGNYREPEGTTRSDPEHESPSSSTSLSLSNTPNESTRAPAKRKRGTASGELQAGDAGLADVDEVDVATFFAPPDDADPDR